MIYVTIATEDSLSEAMLEHLLQQSGRFEIASKLREGGFGYLKRIAPGLNRAAAGHPYIILTDLDTWGCPVELQDDFLEAPRHHNLLFRVAVREVESWLLADQSLTQKLLGLRAGLSPRHPDTLADPKRHLVNLARQSRRNVRDDLVPKRGSSATQGRNYNAVLIQYVQEVWSLKQAAKNSPSLARTIDRLAAWEPDHIRVD
jgi:hypothetical protein